MMMVGSEKLGGLRLEMKENN